MHRRLGAIAAAVALASACYVRTAFRGFSPSPGATVEVTLTRFASDSLTDLLGPDSRVLDGTVLPSGRDTLGLAVSRVLSIKWQDPTVAG